MKALLQQFEKLVPDQFAPPSTKHLRRTISAHNDGGKIAFRSHSFCGEPKVCGTLGYLLLY